MKNMKYKNGLLAYVLITALFFAAGYGAGTISGRKSAENTEPPVRTAAPDTVKASVIRGAELPEYALILENNILTVYEEKDGARTSLTSCEISESVYPSEDMAALKKGMKFDDKNDAMAMFENFAS